MHDIDDQDGHSETEEIGSRERNVQPFGLDSYEGIESTREYQQSAGDSQGWCDLWMDRQSTDIWDRCQIAAVSRVGSCVGYWGGSRSENDAR